MTLSDRGLILVPTVRTATLRRRFRRGPCFARTRKSSARPAHSCENFVGAASPRSPDSSKRMGAQSRTTGERPMHVRRSFIVAGTLLFGAALATAWPEGRVAAADTEQAANQPSIPRLADRLFHVEWTAGATGQQDETRFIGYVYNDSGRDATNVG